MSDWFQRAVLDDGLVLTKHAQTYDSARWATEEVRKAGLLDEDGIVPGRLDRRHVHHDGPHANGSSSGGGEHGVDFARRYRSPRLADDVHALGLQAAEIFSGTDIDVATQMAERAHGARLLTSED